MAEDRAALLDEADRRGLLPPDMKNAYAEAKKRDLIKPAGVMERLGTGFMDPIYGAAQLGSRMSEPGEEMGAALLGKTDEWEAQRKSRQETIDKTIKEREKSIQERRPEAKRGTTDWLRVGGSIPSTAALTTPMLGGIPGAVVGGAMGGLIQPATDVKHFGAEKAKGAMGGAVAGGVLGGAFKAAGAGVRAVGEWLAREYPENVMTQAVQKVLKRMGQDQAAGGPSATQALDLINEVNQRGGKPMTLADVGGENVRALAGNVARQPGEGRNVAQQFLTQRDEMAAQRLNDDIKKYVHGGDSMFKTTQALVQARSAASKPAYEVAMDPARVVDSPRLREFLADPTVKQGIPQGLESQRLEALAAGEPYQPVSAMLDEAGSLRGVPNMRTLDAVKRGLDAQIEGERDAVTGRMSQRGNMLSRVRSEFVKELDALNPDYAAARAAWGGPSASMGAMDAGRAAFKLSPDEIAAEISRMTPSEREFYRLGVADTIRERLMKTGVSGDEAKAIIKNPWMRDQLKPVFRSPEEFDAFVGAVTAEGRMFATKTKVMGGSQTAERLAEDTSTENLMSAGGAHLAKQVATGEWVSAAKNAIRMWRDRQDRAGNPKLNEQISRILFQAPIDPASELGQRLTGRFTGPQGINRLGTAADMTGNVSRVLAPGAGSALAQPTQ
jgi:hypothetical protein